MYVHVSSYIIEQVVIMPCECPYFHERSQKLEQYRLVGQKSGNWGEARQVQTLAASWLLE